MGWITIVIRFLMMIGRIGRSTIERGRERMRRDDAGFVTVVIDVTVAVSVRLRIMRWRSTQRFRYRRSGRRCGGGDGWTGFEI